MRRAGRRGRCRRITAADSFNQIATVRVELKLTEPVIWRQAPLWSRRSWIPKWQRPLSACSVSRCHSATIAVTKLATRRTECSANQVQRISPSPSSALGSCTYNFTNPEALI
jgi:hypothetical protein